MFVLLLCSYLEVWVWRWSCGPVWTVDLGWRREPSTGTLCSGVPHTDNRTRPGHSSSARCPPSWNIYQVWMQSVNKSNVKRWNTLSCLDQYRCKVLTLWNNRGRKTVYPETVRPVKQSRYSWLSGWQWLLYGGYVVPVVVKPENLTFEVKFDLDVDCPPKQ